MIFLKLLYHRKCKRREVGGQKKPNLVNVVCERPPREALVKAGHSGTIVGLELSSALDCAHATKINLTRDFLDIRADN